MLSIDWQAAVSEREDHQATKRQSGRAAEKKNGVWRERAFYSKFSM